MKERTCTCNNCSQGLCTGRVPVFAGLGDEELEKVSELIVHKSYAKGEKLFNEGDRIDSMIIISAGRVKGFRYTTDGREQILYIFSEGDFIGEKNILRNSSATYSAEALENTEVCIINRDHFCQLMMSKPEISIKIMEELCGRLERLEGMIEKVGTRDAEARVGMLLLEFAAKYGKENAAGVTVMLPLSREGMASYIGVARETVSRKLNRLQDEGVIELVGNKKVVIRNREALEQSVLHL